MVDRCRDLFYEIIRSIPGWSDEWAVQGVEDARAYSFWVGRDERPDSILQLPLSEVVSKVVESSGKNFLREIEVHPFVGLVKVNPRRALLAISIAAKAGDYSEGVWSDLIENFPSVVSPRLKRVFLARLARLPFGLIQKVGCLLGLWFQKNIVEILNFSVELTWVAFDRIVDGIFNGGESATRRALLS